MEAKVKKHMDAMRQGLCGVYIRSNRPFLPPESQDAPPKDDAPEEAEEEDEADEEEAEDLALLTVEPISLLDKIPKDFYTLLASTKWKERKEALDALLPHANHGKLLDERYGELISALAKVYPPAPNASAENL